MKKGMVGIALGAAGVAMSGCAGGESERWNVVVLLADDLGYGDLGCYGSDVIRTPCVDGMAAEGLRFTSCYAGSTVSAPSRCSLMTGLTTGHCCIRGNKELNPEGQAAMAVGTRTIGHLMRDAGYATGMFGKWGLGGPGSGSEPGDMGFDEFFGYNCQRQSHRYYPYHLWHNGERVLLEGNEDGVVSPSVYAPDVIQRAGLDWIRSKKDEPFFAMFTYTLPHAELVSPRDSIYELYDGVLEEGAAYHGVDSGRMSRWSNYGSCEHPHATYASMVTRLDSYVGEVLALLRELGVDRKTLVLFASDNGPHCEGGGDPEWFRSSGPFRGVKRDLYEGGIRVPLVAWLPGVIDGGHVSDHVCAFWDVMATFGEMTGQKVQEGDGVSFLPTLTGKGTQREHEFLYWEFHEGGGAQAVRVGDWKLIRKGVCCDSVLELYNLREDVHEDKNLSGVEAERVRALEQVMDGARTESDVFNFGR